MINIKSWANQNGKKRYREKNKTPASKNKTKTPKIKYYFTLYGRRPEFTSIYKCHQKSMPLFIHFYVFDFAFCIKSFK